MMNPPQAATESPDAPASTTKTGTEDPIRVFVAVLTFRLLKKCNAIHNWDQEWVLNVKRLVNQTMDGLIVTKGFCPDVKSTKKVCKAVLKDLQKKIGNKRQLEIFIIQNPAADKVIVESLQSHIREYSARLVKKLYRPVTWKDAVKLLTTAAATLFLVFLPLLLL
ncbi:hypothetical protein PAMA_013681 [Pampus argenteus]